MLKLRINPIVAKDLKNIRDYIAEDNEEYAAKTCLLYTSDTKSYEPKVTMLSYSQADDCFYIDNGIHDGHIKAFEKELTKEALYLKHNAQ